MKADDAQADSKFLAIKQAFEREVESWIVNTLKVNLVRKLDLWLEEEGKLNARKVFLTPVFTITEYAAQVCENAPEMKTLFYKELNSVMTLADKKFHRT